MLHFDCLRVTCDELPPDGGAIRSDRITHVYYFYRIRDGRVVSDDVMYMTWTNYYNKFTGEYSVEEGEYGRKENDK